MIPFLRRRFPRRFLLILMLSTACAVIVAACSSSNGGAGSSAQQIRSGSGWAPQGSLAVVSVDISSTGIDTALATLQRLPSFHLVTAQLPAPQKGAQAREQLVNLLLNAGDSKCSGTNLAPLKGSGKKSPSSKCPSYQHDVAPWLGNEAGLAVLPSPRASGARQHTPRVVGWIESTDDAKAAAFIKQHAKTIKGTAEQNGDSLDSWSAPKSGGGVTVGVLDGAVLIGASRVDLLEVVHAHKDSSTVLGPITDQLDCFAKEPSAGSGRRRQCGLHRGAYPAQVAQGQGLAARLSGAQRRLVAQLAAQSRRPCAWRRQGGHSRRLCLLPCHRPRHRRPDRRAHGRARHGNDGQRRQEHGAWCCCRASCQGLAGRAGQGGRQGG